MERLTNDLNIISSQANQPTLNAQELKSEFDKSGNIIKDFINDIVAPSIEKVESDVSKKVDTKDFETLSSELRAEIETKLSEVDNSIEELSKVSTNYGDFVRTTTTAKTIDHGHGSIKTDVQTITKEGYYPLAIVGYKLSGTVNPSYTDAQPQLLSMYLSNVTNGSCKINVKIKYSNNDNWTYKSTYELEILWIKIKS